jgi:hypothetical protein
MERFCTAGRPFRAKMATRIEAKNQPELEVEQLGLVARKKS